MAFEADHAEFGLPEDSSAPEGSTPRKWLSAKSLSKVGLELLSVFIGVTSAFWLENWRQNSQQRHSADAVYKSLSEEVALVANGGTEIDLEIRRGVLDWRSRYAKGDRPAPYTYIMPRSPRPPTGVWQAAMSSGLINLLDTQLLFCLARYYRRLESSGDEYVDYKHFVENEVLPYADDPNYFYGSNGRLKPRFAGAMDNITRWQNEHVRIVKEARQMLDALNRRTPPAQCK